MRPEEPEETAAGAALAILSIGVFFLPGQTLVPTGQTLDFNSLWGPEECDDRCYPEPDAGEEPIAKLLIPAWYGQADENCDVIDSRYRCLMEFDVDGLRVTKNERAVKLNPGQHAVVSKAISYPNSIFKKYFYGTDGLYLEAKANGVYALCASSDEEERKIRIWIVDNETGQVVVGQKRDFDVKEESSYSRFCPIY
jgi:hypothetical protein